MGGKTGNPSQKRSHPGNFGSQEKPRESSLWRDSDTQGRAGPEGKQRRCGKPGRSLSFVSVLVAVTCPEVHFPQRFGFSL